MENLPPGIRLSCGLEKAKRGAGGNLLIEGGQVPFVWTRGVRLADAVEFAVVRGQETGSLKLNVRHLKRLEKPNAFDAYSQIAELTLLDGLKEFRWEFYDTEKKRWFATWDADKRPAPPLYMKLHFQFLKDPREYEFTYWIANDLAPRTAGLGAQSGPHSPLCGTSARSILNPTKASRSDFMSSSIHASLSAFVPHRGLCGPLS